jgi:hypothetical protein
LEVQSLILKDNTHWKTPLEYAESVRSIRSLFEARDQWASYPIRNHPVTAIPSAKLQADYYYCLWVEFALPRGMGLIRGYIKIFKGILISVHGMVQSVYDWVPHAYDIWGMTVDHAY